MRPVDSCRGDLIHSILRAWVSDDAGFATRRRVGIGVSRTDTAGVVQHLSYLQEIRSEGVQGFSGTVVEGEPGALAARIILREPRQESALCAPPGSHSLIGVVGCREPAIETGYQLEETVFDRGEVLKFVHQQAWADPTPPVPEDIGAGCASGECPARPRQEYGCGRSRS